LVKGTVIHTALQSC